MAALCFAVIPAQAGARGSLAGTTRAKPAAPSVSLNPASGAQCNGRTVVGSWGLGSVARPEPGLILLTKETCV